MQTTSDEVLISRIAGGDRLAMQVLYARHHVRVYRFVLRLVRNEATAEDLISEVFLDIWRQAGKFEGRSAASTWMLSIARFKVMEPGPFQRVGEKVSSWERIWYCFSLAACTTVSRYTMASGSTSRAR